MKGFEAAISLRPDFVSAHVALGRLHSVYRPVEAAASFRRALAIVPDLPEARLGLSGGCFFLEGSVSGGACLVATELGLSSPADGLLQ